ncbi:MAG: hypothetical protein JWP94_42 [Mucilaginibacter sp.]|nr:hypothetical protein [Mucilaginibacter sp.]
MTKSAVLSIVFLILNMAVSGQKSSGVCVVDSKAYPGKDPSMWDALFAASDGKVYTGLCTEGASAHFYVYDPVAQKNTLLFGIAEFERETGKGIRTSGKIHNKPVEDNDGNIYFVPIANGAGPRNIDYTSWSGTSWIRYDPKKGRLDNLGSIEEGCYPLTIDKKKRCLYGVGFTGYFYQFDLDKRITKNFGRVSNWDIGRSIFCDDEGNVYGTFPTARIWKYDIKTDKVIDLSIRLPYDATIYPTELLNPMIDRTNDWRAVEWDPMDKVAYGITCGSGSLLFRYDPHDGPDGKITPLVKMCDSRFLKTDRKDIPFSTLAFAFDNKKKIVYFVPSARDYALDESAETYGRGRPSHLIAYDIQHEKRIDLGELRTADGRKVFGCEAASVSPDGTLYICGQAEVAEPKNATSHIGGIPVALQLLIYKPL